jgi:multidrug efflux pump subunit AcrA (membrane-fusion protein)
LAALQEQLDDIAGHGTAGCDAQQLPDQQAPQPGGARRPETNAATIASSSDITDSNIDTPAGQISFLRTALADAEGAVSLLQQKLVNAVQQQQLEQQRLADLQERAAASAVRQQQQLVAARAAGRQQIASLQDSLKRIGRRADLAGQVTSVATQQPEVSFASRCCPAGVDHCSVGQCAGPPAAISGVNTTTPWCMGEQHPWHTCRQSSSWDRS